MKNDKEGRTPRASVGWPSKVQGGKVVARLRGMKPDLVGNDPVKLAMMVDEALQPPFLLKQREGFDDLIPAHQREAFTSYVREIEARMTEVLALFAADKAGAVARPVFEDVDPVATAALNLIPDRAEALRLAEAYHALTQLHPTKSTGPRGTRAVIDAVYMLVRVVVVYRWQQGLPVEAVWNLAKHRGDRAGTRFNDDECTPISDTAVLVHDIAEMWKIDADNSMLRGALDTFLSQLKRENRAPNETDISPVIFDAKSQRKA